MDFQLDTQGDTMKYYCIANPIHLIKTAPSENFFDNLPVLGTPIFGKLPVTETKMRDAFEQSEELILCSTLDDAMRLRQIKIDKKTNMKADCFNKTANCPLTDYAIYEVEIDDKVQVKFNDLIDAPKQQLAQLVSYDLYFKAIYGDRLDLPCIEICYDKKSVFNPQLLKCHYFPLDGVKENEGMECALF